MGRRPVPRRGLRVLLVILAALGGCVRGSTTYTPDAHLRVTAPDHEAARMVALVLSAYAEPWLADLFPRAGRMSWDVHVAADTPTPGYDHATGDIALLPRTAGFPRDLLHAATLAWCDRACGGGAGLAGMPWYARDGLPLVAEGLAGLVWQDRGDEHVRQRLMRDRIVHDRVPLGVPVDRLGPLTAVVHAGHPPTLASLLAAAPHDPDLAAADAWAVCRFLLQTDARTRDALVHACGGPSQAPAPLASRVDPLLLEDLWQRFLHRLAFGADT